MVAMNYKKPFYEWECFIHGMYKAYSEINNYNVHFDNAIKLMSDQDLFYQVGIEVLDNWVISCNNFLTNKNINRIAFIGQVCCCKHFGVPEIIVKDAWKTIDIETQKKANYTAYKILKTYERRNKELHSKMEEIWV
jgi:hypothetical protein